ncbi:hypothetical protein Scep_001736 [Stephania cephalantha]|uniref:Uncharacterized protein n=1 Tax=Stephania cephalantha TaxID=152367 RepID=A0AAP0LBD1_9MAGN
MSNILISSHQLFGSNRVEANDLGSEPSPNLQNLQNRRPLPLFLSQESKPPPSLFHLLFSSNLYSSHPLHTHTSHPTPSFPHTTTTTDHPLSIPTSYTPHHISLFFSSSFSFLLPIPTPAASFPFSLFLSSLFSSYLTVDPVWPVASGMAGRWWVSGVAATDDPSFA